MTTAYTNEQLFLALRHFRGEDVGLVRRAAASIVHERVNALSPRREFPKRDEGIWEDTLQETRITCCLGRFKGQSVGEAVNFVRTCFRRRYLTNDSVHAGSLRNKLEWRDSVDGADESAESGRLYAELGLVVDRFIAMIPKGRQSRVEAFFRYRIGGVTDIRPGETRARTEQARSVGRRYAVEEFALQSEQGIWKERDQLVLAGLLSATATIDSLFAQEEGES